MKAKALSLTLLLLVATAFAAGISAVKVMDINAATMGSAQPACWTKDYVVWVNNNNLYYSKIGEQLVPYAVTMKTVTLYLEDSSSNNYGTAQVTPSFDRVLSCYEDQEGNLHIFFSAQASSVDVQVSSGGSPTTYRINEVVFLGYALVKANSIAVPVVGFLEAPIAVDYASAGSNYYGLSLDTIAINGKKHLALKLSEKSVSSEPSSPTLHYSVALDTASQRVYILGTMSEISDGSYTTTGILKTGYLVTFASSIGTTDSVISGDEYDPTDDANAIKTINGINSLNSITELKSFNGGVLAKASNWYIVTKVSSAYTAVNTEETAFNSYYGKVGDAYFAVNNKKLLVIANAKNSYTFTASNQVLLPSDSPDYEVIDVGVVGPEMKALAATPSKGEVFDVSGIPVISEKIIGRAGDLLVTKSENNGITYFHLYKVGFNVATQTATQTTTTATNTTTTTVTQTMTATNTTATQTATQTTTTTAQTTTTATQTATNTTALVTTSPTTTTTGTAIPFAVLAIPVAEALRRRLAKK